MLLISITNLKYISPMIIILCVARGQAWDNETVSADCLSSRKVVDGRKPSGLGHRHAIQEISTIQFSSGETELSSEQMIAQEDYGQLRTCLNAYILWHLLILVI